MAGNRETDKRIPGIYVITDKTAVKAYVGSSIDLPKRLGEHRRALVRGDHGNYRLQKAFRAGHQLEVLPIPVEAGVDTLALEQRLLDRHFDSGCLYNLARDVQAPRTGIPHSEEFKRKMSERQTGVPRSEETIAKMRVAHLGKKRSEETRQKMREAQTGKTLGPETIEKIRITSTGRLHTPEARQKMSEAAKGRERTPEHAEKLLAGIMSRRRPCVVNGVRFDSLSEASQALGIPMTTLSRRIEKENQS